jgi:molybdopterin-containing oxidoreductase family membrane subunit
MWFKKLRRSLLFTFIISIVVNIGMWFERYVIIVTSLHRDFLPSSWSMHYPSHIDIGVYIGTIGLFFVFFLLFARYFPVLALNEVKSILKGSGESYKNMPDDHHHEEPAAVEEAPKAEAPAEEPKAEESTEESSDDSNEGDAEEKEDNNDNYE